MLLDSGADLSLAPRRIAERLGLRLDDGVKMMLQGISPRPECSVEAVLMDVFLILEPAGWRFRVPVAFTEADGPFLAGRDGFLELLKVTLDGPRRLTLITRQ